MEGKEIGEMGIVLDYQSFFRIGHGLLRRGVHRILRIPGQEYKYFCYKYFISP
jgi:hypothetical protein